MSPLTGDNSRNVRDIETTGSRLINDISRILILTLDLNLSHTTIKVTLSEECRLLGCYAMWLL
jgi:hypothetical protein